MTNASREGWLLEHAAFSVRLRAPRVAITVPEYERWEYAATVALHRATSIWGGAGFILIPHRAGTVDSLMLRIAAAYDPDHVVAVEAPLADLMEIKPDLFSLTLDNRPLTANEVRALPPIDPPMAHLSRADGTARAAVSEACSPYREHLEDPPSSADRVVLLAGG